MIPAGPGPTNGSVSDLSPYAQLFAQIGPNGEVTKEMALEAFSLAIAPLPGVTVPTGAPPNDAERMDGTFAVNWIRPYMDQLTPDQAAVVNAAIAPDPQVPVHTPEPTTAGGLDAQLASFTQGDLTYYADQARQAYAGKLHRSLAVDWSVTVNATNVKVNGVNAWAYTDLAPETLGGSMCVIHVNPSLSSNTDQVLVDVRHGARDVSLLPSRLARQARSPKRGAPGLDHRGRCQLGGRGCGRTNSLWGSIGWADYLTHPEYVLWSESYDAIGFYQHLREEGIDPLAHFDTMITAFTSSSQPSSANPTHSKRPGQPPTTSLTHGPPVTSATRASALPGTPPGRGP